MSLSSPTRMMSRTKPGTDFASFLLRCHDSKGCSGVSMRGLVLLCTAGSVVYSASLLTYCAHNVHVRFWMGDLVIVSLSIYLAALVPASIMLICKICITAHRRNAKELHKALGGRSAVQEESSCRCSVKTLRFALLVMTLLATLAAVLAYCVVSSGMNVSSSLMLQCGKAGNSQALAQKDGELENFRTSSSCPDGRSLDICQGFQEAFPPPAPFVSYTKVMEYELDCSGWCKSHPPFFNMDATQEACALRLGHHLWTVATVAGAPVLAGAALLASLGFVFYSYEGL
mmetsp:Transcript_62856/g.99654  ORF Transcript_62856/g.99654 Transcript_62856/m.99654 type:complete len:286 (+) Transcript_62856:143-1000(+)